MHRRHSHSFGVFCYFRFQACCKQALLSAIQLVAKVSRFSEAALERDYRILCTCEGFQGLTEAFFADDELADGIEKGASKGKKDECFELIASIQQEKKFIDPDISLETAANDLNLEDPDDALLKQVPDAEDMAKLFQPGIDDTEGEEADQDKGLSSLSTRNPRTLLEALDRARRQGDRAFWNLLWRLNVHLRCGPGGMDVGWLPNGRNCRRASRTLNWHQRLGLGSIAIHR